jgi:hypothetical protein
VQLCSFDSFFGDLLMSSTLVRQGKAPGAAGAIDPPVQPFQRRRAAIRPAHLQGRQHQRERGRLGNVGADGEAVAGAKTARVEESALRPGGASG